MTHLNSGHRENEAENESSEVSVSELLPFASVSLLAVKVDSANAHYVAPSACAMSLDHWRWLLFYQAREVASHTVHESMQSLIVYSR